MARHSAPQLAEQDHDPRANWRQAMRRAHSGWPRLIQPPRPRIEELGLAWARELIFVARGLALLDQAARERALAVRLHANDPLQEILR